MVFAYLGPSAPAAIPAAYRQNVSILIIKFHRYEHLVYHYRYFCCEPDRTEHASEPIQQVF
jgi:hypothetical protein